MGSMLRCDAAPSCVADDSSHINTLHMFQVSTAGTTKLNPKHQQLEPFIRHHK
jgi:hypothetical protein